MARHDESELTMLNDRNIKALYEAIKLDQKKLEVVEKKVEDSMRAVTMMNQQILDLRAQLAAILQARV